MQYRENRFEKNIVILIFILGIMLSILIPTGQIPDEYTHLTMIGDSVGVKNFSDNIMKSVSIDVERLEQHYEEKIDMSQQKNILTQPPIYTRREMLPKKLSIAILKHLPATVGIYIGIILGVPGYWVLQLGELFALAFYAYICYIALKLIPIKKTMMAWFMLFPMALQQASSINYDAVLIPMCYLYISYILYLKYNAEKIKLNNTLILLTMWLLITYIKVPYVLLVLLVFLLPLEKVHISIGKYEVNERVIRKCMLPAIIIMSVCAVLGIYFFRKVWFIQILYGFAMEWKRGLYLLYSTGKTWTEFLFVSTVGNFGWLDTPISLNVALIVFGVVIAFALIDEKKEKKCMNIKDVIVIEGTAIILCVFVTLALVNHTIMVILYGSEAASGTYEIREALYQIPYIGGVQGRYYLPICSLFFIPLPSPICVSIKKQNKLLNIVGIIIYIYIITVLIKRYWGV